MRVRPPRFGGGADDVGEEARERARTQRVREEEPSVVHDRRQSVHMHHAHAHARQRTFGVGVVAAPGPELARYRKVGGFLQIYVGFKVK